MHRFTIICEFKLETAKLGYDYIAHLFMQALILDKPH